LRFRASRRAGDKLYMPKVEDAEHLGQKLPLVEVLNCSASLPVESF
jgi:hypothetical protein